MRLSAHARNHPTASLVLYKANPLNASFVILLNVKLNFYSKGNRISTRHKEMSASQASTFYYRYSAKLSLLLQFSSWEIRKPPTETWNKGEIYSQRRWKRPPVTRSLTSLKPEHRNKHSSCFYLYFSLGDAFCSQSDEHWRCRLVDYKFQLLPSPCKRVTSVLW